MKVNWDDEIPNINGNIKMATKPPTRPETIPFFYQHHIPMSSANGTSLPEAGPGRHVASETQLHRKMGGKPDGKAGSKTAQAHWSWRTMITLGSKYWVLSKYNYLTWSSQSKYNYLTWGNCLYFGSSSYWVFKFCTFVIPPSVKLDVAVKIAGFTVKDPSVRICWPLNQKTHELAR